MPEEKEIKSQENQNGGSPEKGAAEAAAEKPRNLGNLLGLDDIAINDHDQTPNQGEAPEKEAARASAGSAASRPPIWMASPERHQGVLESLRLVKSKISKARREFDGKHYLITGSEPGVGTSTVAQNLAVVLANDFLDQRFLLVDANLSYPSLHKTFGLTQEPGVLNYLLGDYTLDEVTSGSGWPNLDLVTMGKTKQQASSPFDLERFRIFLKETAQMYDLVLLDSAPALRSSQTRVISSQVDWVIIVAEASKTRWEVLVELKNQLAQDGAKTLGGILNKRRFVIPRWAYRFI